MAGIAEYRSYDAVGLADLVARREVSPSELLETAIAAVEAENPRLNAVSRPMFDEARRAVAAGLPDGPLRGIPFLLKDLGINYAGVATTGGSRLFQDFVPTTDSTIVARFKAAGLVILGKSNTPEFGICAVTESQLLGPCRNPWDIGRTPGGSSGGAAAAVAGGMLPMAHATDGGGSIRIPAANCGLFGLKPTRGRTPAGPDLGEGMNGLSTGLCVSRSVRDTAVLLDAVAGAEPGDPYAVPAPARRYADEVELPSGRLRIALCSTTYDGSPVDPACKQAAEAAARLCEDLGHHVEEARPQLDMAAVRRVWRVLPAANLLNTLSQRAAARGRPVSPDEVERITWAWAEEGRGYTGADYMAVVQGMHRIGRQMGRFFLDYDVLLSPTLADPPLPLGAMDTMDDDLDRYIERRLLDRIPFTPLFNETGGAAMTVPLHWTPEGLPVGVQFAGDLGAEAMLLRLAAELEEARPWFDRLPG